MRDVVIVGAMRTAIGDFLGSLKDVSAVDLGVIAFKAALSKAGVAPSLIEEVATGHVYQAGCKGNPSRQVTLGAGCPVETVSVTINQQCPSSMRAAEIISQEIMLGKIDIGAAVGIESMTNVPYLLLKARSGYRMGAGKLEDGMLYDALIDAFYNYHQGITAENLAEKYNITRQEQDELALLSHQRACAAIKDGKLKDEIVPVEIKTKNGTVLFDTDEHPNFNTTMESLAKLKPAFKKDGTVTAGNASAINDAACAAILMGDDKAAELGIKPLARIVATASASVAPNFMGIGVVPAVNRALKLANMKSDDIDIWEINEAFAAQFLACNRELKLDMAKVNVNGSGLSLGHPVGNTGLRLVIATINELKRRNKKFGCASLCAGGGPAMATIIEVL
ncbi:thiolase family protein [Syntrophomonas wolfei]|uniref:thiolase family protein n=1 Tax=Syntrophomonas wolfei TaxID=863 RepID=UPI0023F5768C|nr:thiolase family protein [Syntrophomonas wolfei]